MGIFHLRFHHIPVILFVPTFATHTFHIFSSFTAINVTGERLSHAVGYAFKACLAKKKEIEKANQTLSQESNFPYKEKSVDVQSPGMCDSIKRILPENWSDMIPVISRVIPGKIKFS